MKYVETDVECWLQVREASACKVGRSLLVKTNKREREEDKVREIRKHARTHASTHTYARTQTPTNISAG